MYPREYFDTYWRSALRNEVFVIMSFGAEFQPVWEEAIKPAVEEDRGVRLIAHRVDATTLSGSIVTEILDGIAHARLVFADISVNSAGPWKGQRNGNAMYELGLAHALRLPEEMVVVRSDAEAINFDVAGIKVQRYDPGNLATARDQFSRLVTDGLKQVDQTKSLKVEDAIRRLDADTLSLMSGSGKTGYFSVTRPSTMRDVMSQTASGIKDSIRLLLTLGMIRFDANFAAKAYAYHWTEFGVAVLNRLGIR